ncbi:insulinase family protein [Roseibium polysiphoniae]|uniref:Insulinase family protein n=1 Tax=Roseibium polysiphoniae TaxID=2571221 RepID=A0A944GUD3_9HYPH|nr:insulinase family protein [Roseibium polysiphoniae]
MLHSAQKHLRHAISAGAVALGALGLTLSTAQAVDIQRVVSPKGIEAWLVEDNTVPIIAVNFSFKGGAVQDPEGKEGLTRLLASTLDEGAGDLSSEKFQARMEDLAVGISFNTGKDYFYGSLRTLTPARDEAFDLLRLAVNDPRFDEVAVDRMKAQLAVGIRRATRDPDTIASRNLLKAMLGEHPYATPTSGTEESLGSLTRDDLLSQKNRIFSRDTLRIGVVGDINAETLAPLLDMVFETLPGTGDINPVPAMDVQAGQRVDHAMPVPQTKLVFALPGLKRDDPDYQAAFVMNHILGGGTFTSWLYEEVREKRGLSYSTGTSLSPYDAGGLLLGSAATKADRAEETLAVILEQSERMATEGPTEAELESAKRFLTGSYPLRFDASGKIARQLVALQNADLGIDYFDRRNSEIEAVTLEDVRHVAKRLLDGKAPTVSTVGPASN